jgi:hypothetical protein
MQFLEVCLKTSLLKHGYFGKQMKTWQEIFTVPLFLDTFSFEITKHF